MNFITLLKTFGTGGLQRTLAHYIRELTPAGWENLKTFLNTAALAAETSNADDTSKAIVDVVEKLIP